MASYPLLDQIETPADLRRLPREQLPGLCEELRAFIPATTAGKAGHIRSSLAVTELTVALHYQLRTPEDILIWDVGHQAYVHKVLTGRKKDFHLNRQPDGPSGFTRREESPYDPFGAGHSSTALSALAGFAQADRARGHARKRVAVVGDGALNGGMAYEALNFMGQEGYDVCLVLNDNQSSIDPNVGALQQKDSYQDWFEALGFSYRPCPAADVESICQALEALPSVGPQVLHVRSEKPALAAQAAVSSTGEEAPTFQAAFAKATERALAQNSRLQVISPAMLSGAGLSAAAQRFSDRVWDVGIAEQHAVTMAAGMAAAGAPVLCHLYSTFAQRAFDQIVHDVVLQGLPVVFALDRAGLVGADGPTHHGLFDVGMLQTLPAIQIWAPSHPAALEALLPQALALEKPVAIRYPKDHGRQPTVPFAGLRPHFWQRGQESCILSVGSLAPLAQAAVAGTGAAHLHFPVLKPFPEAELEQLLKPFSRWLLLEELPEQGGVYGSLLKLSRQLNPRECSRAGLPDRFLAHGPRDYLLAQSGLSLEELQDWLGKP
ncbi:MAG: 1-deoxy-D-xylulose-5-phosphate synthase N-terminal domain-containing protein [Schleiferiaceae bacterium]|nr:1-deoxy-D-xylulose-5-phosphate synthase N-terminal domain-containing protein [Schleiferiaceae bacterium]